VADNSESGKRRLPVLSANAAPSEPPRPPWHWIGFGAVAIFVVWLPLVSVADAISRRLVAGRAESAWTLFALVVPHAAALVLAAVAGGFLVTRFGAGTRTREAWLAGLAVGLLALGLTWTSAGISLGPLVVPALATAAAAAGGAIGKRRGV
jgi:hypothetical protein